MERTLPFSLVTIVEDILQQQGKRLSDIDLASKKAEEASQRRYEAAGWLRSMVGVVQGKDLPAQPSEEEFRLGLRSGIILCNVLNKVQPGAISKVIEAPSIVNQDGAALSAFQYFENVRNFLVAVEEMGLPTFEASDLEQGGKSSRIVFCILALKSYNEWKQGGGYGSWRYSGILKPTISGKPFVRRNSEQFNMGSLKTLSEKSSDSLCSEQSSLNDPGCELNEMGISCSLKVLVRELILDKKPEEIPGIVENMLGRVVEEFEHRLAGEDEQIKSTTKDADISVSNNPLPKSSSGEIEIKMALRDGDISLPNNPMPKSSPGEREMLTTLRDVDISIPNKPLPKSCPGVIEMENEVTTKISEEKGSSKKDIQDEEQKFLILKRQMLIEQQQNEIQSLKYTLHTAKAEFLYLQMKCQEDVNNLGTHLHGLANAASGYRRVLEENRKLYNQVQDLKGSIRVYCRVRPFLPGQPNNVTTVEHIDEGSITIVTPSKYGKEGRKSFTFNKVFSPSATQEEVFADTQPLIRSVLDGYNVCIFAYGQTGSGKTHTMSGPKELTPETVGVNYRALSDLFMISEQRKDTTYYEVSVQMIEIYNDQARDLLATDGGNKKVEIRKSGQKGINVPDANIVQVSSTADVIHLMNLGLKNRAVGFTAMNDRSSRSHSCLTIHVQGRELTSGTTLRGCLHLVDLAGSERVDKSEVVGDRLKEAQHINKSLAALGDVISSLAQKSSHVPYRNSRLTQLLQDSLGGQAKTLMFVHISPELDAVGETISTLKFAERVSTVELGGARVNKDSTDVKELKEQIASLKAALARKEGETGQIQQSVISSLSTGSSPSYGSGDGSSRHSIDSAGHLERNNSSSKLNAKSLDVHDFLNTTSWPPLGKLGVKEDEKEAGSGGWVDTTMLNKQAGVSSEEISSGSWEEDNRRLPEMFHQQPAPDPSKIYPEQPFSKLSTNRSELGTTDESDDFEAATSDSSETDLLWQLNVPRATSTPNGLVSKIKKPSQKQVKGTESRSLIPAPPTRRLANGHSSALQKTGRQPIPVDGKRRTGGK